MPRISEASIREIKDRMDAIAVVGGYVRLENRGGRWKGLCPFHNEKTPSFTVDPNKKLFHCFGCGEGGDIIKFVMNIDKLSYPEALTQIARASGIDIVYDETGGGGAEEAAAERRLEEELFTLYEGAAKSFHYILKEKDEGKAALAYLAQRKVSEAMIERFNLGYAPAGRRWLYDFLVKKGFSAGFLAQSGLFSPKYPESAFFQGRLMFPIHKRSGKTAAFGGRALGNAEPKYLNSPETAIFKKRDTLFALDFALQEIRRTKEVYLVEGYMDVIAMHQAGLTNTVAPLGTAFTDDHARLLLRYAERALLFFDMDNAGQKAVEKAIMTCNKAGLASFVVSADSADTKDPVGLKDPSGFKDPSEILQKNGADHLQKIAKCVIIPLRFLIARSLALYDVSDPSGKQKAALSLFSYLASIQSEVVRSDALHEVADALLCDNAALARDYAAWLSGSYRFSTRDEERGKPQGQGEPIRLTGELFVLLSVLANIEEKPEFLARLRHALPVEEVRDPNAKELYLVIEEEARSEGGHVAQGAPGLSAVSIYERLGAAPFAASLKSFVIDKCSSFEFTAQPERIFADGLLRLKKQRLEERRIAITQKLRSLGKDGGRENEELLEEKMYIDNELLSMKSIEKR